MIPARRLPTGALLALAVALLAAGTLWWAGAAPADPPAPARTGDVVFFQFRSGAIVASVDDGQGSPFPTGLVTIIDSEWPCRVVQPGNRFLDLRRGFELVPPTSARIVQLPVCTSRSSFRR